ncbi:MAG: hypothetical protein HY308_19510 [Gammaproteobacteria bacterium]|nr:hypothetical protein [Gammaproteobacteria bacterium]
MTQRHPFTRTGKLDNRDENRPITVTTVGPPAKDLLPPLQRFRPGHH